MKRLSLRLACYGAHTTLAAFLMCIAPLGYAIDTATLITSAVSLQCLSYRIVGICYWLDCNARGCRIRTSVKVRHYIPDAVVSSYANTGENPWVEIAPLSPPNLTAQAGGDGTTNQDHENNLTQFKNADVIGHPANAVFSQFAGQFGYSCSGPGIPFMPYHLSVLDTVAWRYNLPELVYPESLIPGQREIGTRTSKNLWGNVYPRGGLLHQADSHKAAAVVAQRAGDIVTRRDQPHVYQPLLAKASDGYWPAGALMESDPKSGYWQELTPTLSDSCAAFPHSNKLVQAKRGDYAWALWRPYSCCKKRGQVFLGSVDF